MDAQRVAAVVVLLDPGVFSLKGIEQQKAGGMFRGTGGDDGTLKPIASGVQRSDAKGWREICRRSS